MADLVLTLAEWAPLAEAIDRIRTAVGTYELMNEKLQHLLETGELPSAVHGPRGPGLDSTAGVMVFRLLQP
jgi:hypothetical protein